jgi:hypothetical protein
MILVPLSLFLGIYSIYLMEANGRHDGERVGIFAGLTAILYFVIAIGSVVYVNFQYNRDFASEWDLGVKASTIKLKQEHVHKFYTNVSSHADQFRDS